MLLSLQLCILEEEKLLIELIPTPEKCLTFLKKTP